MDADPSATSSSLNPPELSADDMLLRSLREQTLDPPVRPGLLASLDRFEILRVLGEGGMGLVFLAREPATDTQVAVKVMRPELTRNSHCIRQFLTEARHMYRLDHPNILRVLEVCDRAAGPYYVMPYKAGGSLAATIKPGQPLESSQILSIATQVAAGLAHAHAQGIIHRDVKPHNVLLGRDGQAYVSDFGLVRAFDRNESIIQPGREGRLGTLAYMSPAVARGQAEDTRCDIYSFGAMLYEMLTGRPPYVGVSQEFIIQQILDGPPTPVRVANRTASPELTTICEGCMARELRDRYATMDDVVADLKRIQGHQKPVGPRGFRRSRYLMPVFVGVLVTFSTAVFAAAWFAGSSTASKTAAVSRQPAHGEKAVSARNPTAVQRDTSTGLLIRWAYQPDGSRRLTGEGVRGGISLIEVAGYTPVSLSWGGRAIVFNDADFWLGTTPGKTLYIYPIADKPRAWQVVSGGFEQLLEAPVVKDDSSTTLQAGVLMVFRCADGRYAKMEVLEILEGLEAINAAKAALAASQPSWQGSPGTISKPTSSGSRTRNQPWDAKIADAVEEAQKELRPGGKHEHCGALVYRVRSDISNSTKGVATRLFENAGVYGSGRPGRIRDGEVTIEYHVSGPVTKYFSIYAFGFHEFRRPIVFRTGEVTVWDDIELEPVTADTACNIRGTVSLEGGGDPSGAIVFATDFDGITAHVDKDGRFAIPRAPAGTYAICAQKPGYTFSLYASNSFLQTRKGETKYLNLMLYREQGVALTCTLTGRIQCEDNAEPQGATIELLKSPGAQVEVDANGRFSMTGVPTGRHTLIAEKRGYFRTLTTVETVRGKTVDPQFSVLHRLRGAVMRLVWETSGNRSLTRPGIREETAILDAESCYAYSLSRGCSQAISEETDFTLWQAGPYIRLNPHYSPPNFKVLGEVPFESVVEAPQDGYSERVYPLKQGTVYAFRSKHGYYAKFQVLKLLDGLDAINAAKASLAASQLAGDSGSTLNNLLATSRPSSSTTNATSSPASEPTPKGRIEATVETSASKKSDMGPEPPVIPLSEQKVVSTQP